jgi:enoyl-CoA hydratase/carnithine racemase
MGKEINSHVFSTCAYLILLLYMLQGLVPDMGISVTLREIMPIDIAKELTMTARVFSGVEAKEYGIVTK